MKLKNIIIPLLSVLVGTLSAEVPGIINYQGRVQVKDSDFTGTGLFKFALVRSTERSGVITTWSHDGTSTLGSEPLGSLKLTVTNGLFSVGLGESSAILPDFVGGEGTLLRVWFNDGTNGFSQLVPDRPLRSVPFALEAASVSDNSITSEMLRNNIIGANQLTDDIALGNLSNDGLLTLLGRHTGGGIVPPGAEYERVRLWADAPGTLVNSPTGAGGIDLFDENERRRVSLRAQNALFSLTDDTGDTTLFMRGQTASGGSTMNFLQSDGDTGLRFRSQSSATSGGILTVHDSAGSTRIEALGVNGTLNFSNEGSTQTTLQVTGDNGKLVALDRIGIANSVGANQLQSSLTSDNRGGLVRTRRSNGQESTLLLTDASGGGAMRMRDASGDLTVELEAATTAGNGSRLQLREADGSLSVSMGAQGLGGGGFLTLRDSAGNVVIELDASEGGNGVTRTQVLEITGGSDLSERFDISPLSGVKPEPGMLVSIDPNKPGDLIPSSTANDRKVAGVISGAGGVNPGMLMGQTGSIADGHHPVALSGRVYCRVVGPVEPGDLITTSTTPGHGVRVEDHAAASGAIIGKAMTSNPSGQGLVLVLVSLQ